MDNLAWWQLTVMIMSILTVTGFLLKMLVKYIFTRFANIGTQLIDVANNLNVVSMKLAEFISAQTVRNQHYDEKLKVIFSKLDKNQNNRIQK